MRIRLDKITVEQVEVEIPDACPLCRSQTKGGIRYFAYDAVSYNGTIESEENNEGGVTTWFEADGTDAGDAFECQAYVTEVSCSNCSQTLATTED
jgi:hypothetical protein